MTDDDVLVRVYSGPYAEVLFLKTLIESAGIETSFSDVPQRGVGFEPVLLSDVLTLSTRTSSLPISRRTVAEPPTSARGSSIESVAERPAVSHRVVRKAEGIPRRGRDSYAGKLSPLVLFRCPRV